MSLIDDLIKEQCPEGVRHAPLGALGAIFGGLSGKSKADFQDGNARFVSYVNVYNNLAVDVGAEDFVRIESGEKQRTLSRGDVLFTASSETPQDVGMSSVVTAQVNEPLYLNSFCIGFRLNSSSQLNPDFAKHLFRSSNLRRQIIRTASGVTRFNVSKAQLAKVRIPLPPIEVQDEIVRILDSLVSLEAGLGVQLDAELAARRHQYALCREAIVQGKGHESQTVRLDQVADILVGFAFKSAQFSEDTEDVRLIRGDNIGQGVLKERTFKRWRRRTGDALDRYELRKGDVVLAMDRPWIPAGLKWARITEDVGPALLVQRVARLRAENKVLDQRFLGWVISSPAFTDHVLKVQTGNTVPHISGGQIGAFQFELPALPEQVRIAAALDQLDALVDDLSVSLAAERRARRAQYEHYRDSLSSFEEAGVLEGAML